MDRDIALIHALADAAGAEIRPLFRAAFTQETKADDSPVTQADRAAERAIRAILARERPDDGVIGEEYGADRPDAARIWVIDPIDGTRAFVAGRPIFGTLIALIEEGVPVLGVIDQPISGERWIGASGRPTLFNGTPVRTRMRPRLDTAIFATTAPWLCSAFDEVRAATGDTVLGGDCYNYGLLASGHVDLVVEDGLKLHDFAALVPVIEGAGGRMTDWSGAPLGRESRGDVLAVGDPALIDAIVPVLEQSRAR
jgi:inositol-phosphate phosphatase / L-galactose 1-phosphate phosphatase / histidinol-phosphatase